jgi:hypothetical protein
MALRNVPRQMWKITVVIGGAQVVDAPLMLSQNATDDGQALRFGTPTERIGPESVIARGKRSVHG